MIWHYLKEAVGVIVVVHALLRFRHPVKEGPLRRIWNKPMRVAVRCWLLALLLSCLGTWVGNQPEWTSVGINLGNAAFLVAEAGVVSLGVFLAGFLITMFRDFQPQNRLAPVENETDSE